MSERRSRPLHHLSHRRRSQSLCVTEPVSQTDLYLFPRWLSCPRTPGPSSVVLTSPDGSQERISCDSPPAPSSPGGGIFSSDTSAATGTLLNQELDNIWQLAEMEPDNKCEWVGPALSIFCLSDEHLSIPGPCCTVGLPKISQFWKIVGGGVLSHYLDHSEFSGGKINEIEKSLNDIMWR